MKTGLCLLVVAACAVAAMLPVQAAEPKDSGIVAITAPSQRVKLSFRMQGTVTEVSVKPGDMVASTQPIAKQYDRLELAELDVLKVEAMSDVFVRNAINELDHAKVELKRYENLFANNACSETELEKAKLEVEKGKLSVEKAQQDQQQAKLKVEKQQRLIELLQLRPTAMGIVEKVDIEPGEVADPSKPAITIVVTNPLRVEANLPVKLAQALSIGQKLKVRYPGEPVGSGRDATINYRAPVADAGSRTQLIWLELPNPDKKDAGLQVFVDVPENLAEAGKP